jgi:uncharacterized protein (TIGR02001 family)
MKKLGMVAVAVALFATLVSVAGAEDKVTGDVYVGPVNKYVFRGLDLSGNQWVVQGGADLSYKGFTLSYWSNWQGHAAGATPSSKITETDITLNYAFTPIELVTLNVGNIYYSLEGLQDTNELYVKTTLNTLLSPTLSIYWDWDAASKAGLFYTLSVGHTFPLCKTAGLNLGALASYNQQNFSTSENYNNLHNYELSASIDYAPTSSIKITPWYTYSNAFNGDGRNAGVKDESIYGIKAAFVF